MTFTLQVFFTGLGIGLIRKDKNKPGYVAGVDLLLVDTTEHMHMAGPQHLPRLCFEVEDLAKTSAPQVDISAATTTGMPLVMLDLAGRDVRIDVTGNGNGHFKLKTASPGATKPGRKAPKDAVDWIPDLQADLGIADLVQPGASLSGSPYAARVKLPAGKVSSDRLFYKQTKTLKVRLAKFEYGDAPTSRVLADQFVWTRTGVSSVDIAGFDGTYQLDAKLRSARREPRVVRIAVTCLPATLANPDRFRMPDHFPMFQMVSNGGTAPRPVYTVGGGPVCSGAACPPPRSMI